jgi:hypothetical protein
MQYGLPSLSEVCFVCRHFLILHKLSSLGLRGKKLILLSTNRKEEVGASTEPRSLAYICMHVRVYTFTICMYIVYVCVHVCLHVCMRACIYIYIYIYIYICKCVRGRPRLGQTLQFELQNLLCILQM